MSLEVMRDFFDTRAETYDDHMLVDLQLDEFYTEIGNQMSLTGARPRVLDLGCGTGLELQRLYARYPDAQVTGVDVSGEMLRQLQNKFPGRSMQLICGSYFEVPFGEAYDMALSTYSLHHWNEQEKLFLYQKIYHALAVGVVFLQGDYTCQTPEQEQFFQSELLRLRAEQGLSPNQFYHYDTPFTAATEMRLLRTAGFQQVRQVRQWENTGIFTAIK